MADEARLTIEQKKALALARARLAVKEAQAGPSLTERAHVLTGGMLEGVPVAGPAIRGLATRAGAGIRSAISGEPFQEELAGVQARSQQLKQELPKTNIGGQLTGAVAGIAPAIAAVPSAFGLGAGSLAARAGASGLTSGTIGAADAAARSGGDIGSIARGGLLGGALGAAAPVVGQGVGRVANRLMRKPRPSAAERKIAVALGREGMTPDEAATAAQRLGPAGMPADVGPALTEYAEGIASMPGRGQQLIRGKLAERTAGGSARVTQATTKALGGKQNLTALVDDISARQAEAAKPLYQEAFSVGDQEIWSPTLERLSASSSFKTAMRKAVAAWNDTQIADGFGAMNPGAMVKHGVTKFQGGKVPVFPNLQFWDYTKRSLDDAVRVARRAGQNSKARNLTQITRMFRDELDRLAGPQYKAARDSYAGPAAIKEALEEGQGVFASKLGPDELAKTLEGMTASERQAFQQGARGAVANAMGTARNDVNAARAMFEKGHNQEKLALLIGDDAAKEMLSGLRAETQFMNTRNQIIGNSRTAPRQQIMRELGGSPSGPGAIRSLMNLNAGDAAAIAGSKAARLLNAPGIERRNTEIARLLMDPLELAKAGPRMAGAEVSPQLRAVINALMIGGGQRAATLGGGGF